MLESECMSFEFCCSGNSNCREAVSTKVKSRTSTIISKTVILTYLPKKWYVIHECSPHEVDRNGKNTNRGPEVRVAGPMNRMPLEVIASIRFVGSHSYAC